MEHAERPAALDRLSALVGEWTMEAVPPGGPPWPGEARVSFRWMKTGMVLVEEWTVDAPGAPDGVALFGIGDEPERFRQHYFDSRGERRIYEMTLRDGIWRMWRDDPDPFPQRFEGRFDEDGRTIAGRWERAMDGFSWETDFDLTYRRADGQTP